MKPISSNVTRGIQKGTVLKCIDNSGAKLLRMISAKNYSGKKRRLPKAGIADVIICSVIKGTEKIRHTVVHGVIVRQKQPYRRANGIRVLFEDNAAVVVNPKTLEPQGTEIRSAIAKEAVERFSVIGKIASIVV